MQKKWGLITPKPAVQCCSPLRITQWQLLAVQEKKQLSEEEREKSIKLFLNSLIKLFFGVSSSLFLAGSFNGKRSLICEMWNVVPLPSLTSRNLSQTKLLPYDDDDDEEQAATNWRRFKLPETRGPSQENKSTIAARTSIFSSPRDGNLSMLERRRMGRRSEVAHTWKHSKKKLSKLLQRREEKRSFVVKFENPPWSNHHNFELYLFLDL